ncbi:MAG: PAS domain S-box protein [Chloroflexota bacterium]|nr:MAG: PAS domain S-box protein [Chloroflexota bacterium]
MKAAAKTKEQLIKELDSLRKRVAKLELVEAKYKRLKQELKLRDQIIGKTVQVWESAGYPIFLHDTEGNFLYANEAAARLHGYTKEELLKMNLRNLEAPDSAKLYEKRMKKAVEEGEVVFEVGHYHKDGSALLFEMHTRATELDGNLIFFSTAFDITGRRRAEEALRDSEARYRYLFEHSQVANALVGLDGKIINVNKAAAQLYGYDKSEIIGRELLEFVAPESLTKVAEAFSHGLAGTHAEATEVEITTKQGPRTFFFPGGYHMLFEGGKEAGFLISAIDITAQKGTEEALKHSEERYRTILDEMEDGYFEVDLAGNFTFVNDANCRQLGYPREELIGMNYRAIIASDDVEKVYKTFNHVYREGQPVRAFTCKTVLKDGSTGTGEISVFPIRDEKGEIIGFRGVGRDIAERMQLIEDLRRSEERYRTVLDEMGETYYELDLAGNLTFFNDALIRKVGRSREELMGIAYKDYIPAKDMQRVFKAFNQVYKTGKPLKGLPLQIIRKDGISMFSEDTILPLRNEAGEIIGFRGVSHDVTERLEMMEALRQSEERYRTMLDEMEEAYYEVDLAGNFTFFSDALCRQLGYSREEIMGMSYKVYIPRDNAKKVFEAYNRVYRTGEPLKSFASAQIMKDGTLVFTEDSIFPLRNEDGEITGFRGISRDVTERRRAEEERKQLEQKAQFASRLASVGELASGVAHEINNPLTAVIGYAHLLLERKDVPEDIRRDVEVINEGAQRVAGIIRKLLVFARQTKPERTYVDINEIINTTLDLRAYSLQSNNVRVVLQFDPDLPMTVADPGQLQQVFLNLIINAETEVKLANGGGRLAIKTEQTDNSIRVSFKDNGLGIAKENLERIFNPFFTTRKVGQGTGLGLSVCHGIVTAHKGRIWAESQLGKGAKFIVELPILTEDKQLELPEPVVQEPGKVAGARILVVDDEEVIRQFVSQMLLDEGHEVESANSAEDALEEINNKDYQVIMLDIKMPGMSGIDLYRHFQKESPSIADKVVFITGDVMGPSTMDFLSKTKVPYIIKPFDAKQLKTEVNRVLSGGAVC